MNLSDILDVLSDDAMIKVSAAKPFLGLDSDADIDECSLGVVREFKKLPDDFTSSFVVEIRVFGDMLDVFINTGVLSYHDSHLILLADVLTALSNFYYCSVNSGLVSGDATYLLHCLTPDYLGHTVAGISVDDDRTVEITLIDK